MENRANRYFQKQPSRDVLRKMCSEDVFRILFIGTPMDVVILVVVVIPYYLSACNKDDLIRSSEDSKKSL